MKMTWNRILLLIGLGIVCIVCSIIVPFYRFLPAWRHWEETYLVDPGKNATVQIDLIWGTTIEGILVIIGGNNEVYFSLSNSHEEIIVPYTIVSNRYYFGPFILSNNANCTFAFNNDMDLIATKSIYWIVRTYWYSLTFKILGVWFLTIGVIAALSRLM